MKSLQIICAFGALAISASAEMKLPKSTTTLSQSIRTSDHFEPHVARPEQGKAVAAKLKELETKHGKKPNIVWIVVDDMGFGDPGCYGGGASVGAATPTMDMLAREGLKLTSCYSQHTCTPTRSAILTGRLPVRTGLTRPILAGDTITKNPWADEVSLPTLLGKVGYTTVLTGKWHIGEAEGMRPHDVGFDEFYGYYPAQKEISQRVDARRYPDLVLDPEKFAAFKEMGMGHSLVHGFKGGKTTAVSEVKSTEDMGRADQVLADFTVQKIKELSKAGKPFFLEHCFMKVHCDNFPNPDLGTLSAARYPYKEAIAEVDLHTSKIVEALEQAGVLENTFIFFTSDNGPQMDGWPDAGYTPFRGAKGTTFEGGPRVPGIAYWKGMIKPGRESDELFDLMDLFGVAMNLAGVSSDVLPKDRYYDYIDNTSFLLADEGKSLREKVFFWWGSTLMAVRMKEYKLHVKVIEEKSTNRYIDYSTIQDVGLAPWLFNLYIDPKEQIPVGHRMNAFLATMGAELKHHGATFKLFPPKNIGL